MSPATLPDFAPAFPELFLVIAAMALLMVGVFNKETKPADGIARAKLVGVLSVASLVGAAFLAMFVVEGERILTFSGLFVADPFSQFFKVLVLLASLLTLIISQEYMERQGICRFEYPVVVLLACVGMMMMISANNLMSLYMGLELQSLSLYILASFQRDDTRSTEAGLKYFVLGALASGMLLYGMSLVYGFTGTTDFNVLAELFMHSEEAAHGHGAASLGLIVGIVFMLAGLAFKVSAVPFHMWTPDVYEGAPTPVTAFFAVAPKIAAMALFARVMLEPFGDLIEQWRQIIVFISIASMLLGAVAAISQTNIKRLMAYSSIGHVGYALIGLAAGGVEGLRGIMIYMAIYLFMNVGVFAIILCMKRSDRMVEEIEDLAGLSKTHPKMALALVLFMFSMAGIPPLAGFFGKFYIFLSAINVGLYALAVIGVLASVISAFYYLRIIKVMYFDEAHEPLDKGLSKPMVAVMTISGIFITFFALVPGPLEAVADSAARMLLGG
ncbi:MAG: NADH-quinone oxidoreductase subunit NuoN [Magnetovibrionaceae bacterium]